jgi:hypothetical protein
MTNTMETGARGRSLAPEQAPVMRRAVGSSGASFRDEFGFVTKGRRDRAQYPARVPPAFPDPAMKDLVRAAVEQYMRSSVYRKKIEKAVTSALTQQATRWRNRLLRMQEVSESAERYSIDAVLEVAAQITNTPVDVLQGPTRARKVAWPRHFAIVLLHIARRDLSYPQLGKVFGGRDHTTVMHALNRSLVRCRYPECARWYADPRAAEILRGSEYAADDSGVAP